MTDGLRRALDREELEGVLAHEISHVHNRDILISAISATVAAASIDHSAVAAMTASTTYLTAHNRA